MGKAKKEPETVKHEVASAYNPKASIQRQDRMLRCIAYLEEHSVEIERLLGCGSLVVRETLERLRGAAKSCY